MFWYRKAAEQGHAEAQCKLGFLYRFGLEVVKNDAQAAQWYEKSAGQGAAPLICDGGAFPVFLVGLALKTPSANIGAPSTREVMVL